MKRSKVILYSISLVALIGCAGISINRAQTKSIDPRLDKLSLPEGFQIEVFAENVPNARAMALGDKGTVFVGSRREGKVHALVDTDGDRVADEMYLLADGLKLPSGVAFRDGDLYVAEVHQVWKLPNIESQLANPPKKVMINDQFPTDTHHGWKYLGFGPDGKLYVPVGAPCNICESEEEIYASITRMNPDGSDLEIYAKGVRNSVGFAWHPETKELYFTDNGRDWLGDDSPNDELNCAPKKGMHFGYPYCHQGDTPDPEFGEGKSCSNYTPPVQFMGPHVAALGLKFYTGKQFPTAYKNRLIIAQHGSWNRSEPSGYRVMMVDIVDGKAQNFQPFVTGWLEDDKAWGRPVDVMQYTDGSMLISDDYSDMIYRVTYQK